MEERPRPGGEDRDNDQTSAEARKRRVHQAMRSLQGHAEEEKSWHELTSDDEEEKEAAENRTKHNRREVALDALAHRERRGVPSGTLHGLFDRSLNSEDAEQSEEHQTTPEIGRVRNENLMRDDEVLVLPSEHEEALELPPVDPQAGEAPELTIDTTVDELNVTDYQSPYTATSSRGRNPYRPTFFSPPSHTRHGSAGGTGGHGGGSSYSGTTGASSGGGAGGSSGGGRHGGGGHGGGTGGHGGGPGGPTGGAGHGGGNIPPVVNMNIHGGPTYNTLHNHNITHNHNVRRRAIAGLLLVDLIDYVAARRREGKIKRKNEADHKDIRASIEKHAQNQRAELEANQKHQQDIDQQLKRLRQEAEERDAQFLMHQETTEQQGEVIRQKVEEKATDVTQSTLNSMPVETVQLPVPSLTEVEVSRQQPELIRQQTETSPDRRIIEQQAAESLYEKLHEVRGSAGGDRAGGGAMSGAGPVHPVMTHGFQNSVPTRHNIPYDPEAFKQYRPAKSQATSTVLWVAVIVIIIFLFAVILFAR